MENLSSFKPPHVPSFLISFTRSQIAAVICTVFDWGVLFGLVEIFHIWYVLAVTIGAIVGAVTNFLMNRHWSFRATHRHWHGQALRYSIASGLGILLNAGGVYACTEWLKIHYSISVVLVSILVGLLVNYPLHRFFVFK